MSLAASGRTGIRLQRGLQNVGPQATHHIISQLLPPVFYTHNLYTLIKMAGDKFSAGKSSYTAARPPSISLSMVAPLQNIDQHGGVVAIPVPIEANMNR